MGVAMWSRDRQQFNTKVTPSLDRFNITLDEFATLLIFDGWGPGKGGDRGRVEKGWRGVGNLTLSDRV